MMMTAGMSTMDLHIILNAILVVIAMLVLVMACYLIHRRRAGGQQGNDKSLEEQNIIFSLEVTIS